MCTNQRRHCPNWRCRRLPNWWCIPSYLWRRIPNWLPSCPSCRWIHRSHHPTCTNHQPNLRQRRFIQRCFFRCPRLRWCCCSPPIKELTTAAWLIDDVTKPHMAFLIFNIGT